MTAASVIAWQRNMAHRWETDGELLINKGHATGQDVVKLAHHIRQTVADKFGVYLQPEVRFMGANGEVNSEQAIS